MIRTTTLVFGWFCVAVRNAPTILAALLCSCATPSFKSADCVRFRFFEYNVLACDDVAVGNHCSRGGGLTDHGKPVDYKPRACFIRRGFGRKPNIYIGKSYLSCLPHETCHLEYPDDDAMCADRYPCIGDRK